MLNISTHVVHGRLHALRDRETRGMHTAFWRAVWFVMLMMMMILLLTMMRMRMMLTVDSFWVAEA